jgi:hypothetical protein
MAKRIIQYFASSLFSSVCLSLSYFLSGSVALFPLSLSFYFTFSLTRSHTHTLSLSLSLSLSLYLTLFSCPLLLSHSFFLFNSYHLCICILYLMISIFLSHLVSPFSHYIPLDFVYLFIFLSLFVPH